MAFNPSELHVIRAYIALTGEAPTQQQLEEAFDYATFGAFARDLITGDDASQALSDEEFVTSLYENLLGEAPDADGLAYWVSLMNQGLTSYSRAEVLVHLQNDAANDPARSDAVADIVEAATDDLESVDGEFAGTPDEDDGDDDGETVEVTRDFSFETAEGEANVSGWTNTDEHGQYVSQSNTIFNVGKEAIDKGVSSDISAQYTFDVVNQLGAQGQYNAYFLSPTLNNTTTVEGNSLVLELIDRHATDDSEALSFVAIQAFSFYIDGERQVISSEDILNASDYDELLAAIQAELVEQGLDDQIEARLGNTFQRQQTDPETQQTTGQLLNGTQIVLDALDGQELSRGSFETGVKAGTGVENIDLAAAQTVTDTSITSDLISTNLELQNVGYGSQGGSVNLSGQSESLKGVQEFNVDAQAHARADLGVWLTSLASNPHRGKELNLLEVINLDGEAPYFFVGEQNGENVERRGDGGLTDVREFNASSFGGDIQLDALVTHNVIGRDFNLVDDQANPAGDNLAYSYDLGSGSNVLFLDFSQEAIAHEDASLSITGGNGGNTIVTNLVNTREELLDSNWLVDQQMLDNFSIELGNGDNTVWTEGDGDATITTGSGNDTIYADNSGSTFEAGYNLGLDDEGFAALAEHLGNDNGQIHAHWVLNADNTDINDLRGVELGNQLLQGAQVRVTFSANEESGGVMSPEAEALQNGLEALADIPTTNGTANQAQVNQAIKDAVNNDPVMNKLLVAKDGPNNTLIIESLIDGSFVAEDLDIEILPGSTDSDDDNFIGNTALSQLQSQLALEEGDSDSDDLTPAQVQDRLNTGANNMQATYQDSLSLASVGASTPAVPGAPTVYTFDLDGAEVDDGNDLTFSGEVVFTNNDINGDGSAADAAAMAGEIDGDIVTIDGVTYDITTDGTEVTLTSQTEQEVTADVTVGADEDPDAGTVFSPEETGSDPVPGTGEFITGSESDAWSNNVINAGNGQDVIVLGTGEFSSDTVEFTGNFGHNTIVNFDNDMFAAETGGDQLDFTSYLTAQTSSSDSAASAVVPVAQIDIAGNAGALQTAMNGSANSIINFTGFDFTAEDDETWSELTASAFESALTGGNGFAGIAADFEDDFAEVGDLFSGSHKSVVFVENSANLGEYKVFEFSTSEESLDNVTLLGVVDFGNSIDFNGGNFVGAEIA